MTTEAPLTTRASAARARLREIVATVLEMETAEVGDSDRWVDELGMDSLEKVETVTRIREEFGLALPAREASRIGSVADVLPLLDARGYDLVERLVGRQLAAGRGDLLSYADPDVGAVSYAALYEAARGYAGALAEAGVMPGSRGVVLAEDSVATVVAVLGHWWNGSVPVMVSPLLGDGDIAFAVEDCAARIVHLDGGDAKRSSLRAELAGRALVDGEDVRRDLAGTRPPAVLRPAAAGPAHVWPADGETLVQYTSGSTGTPKGVRHSAAGIIAMIDGFGEVLGLRPEDRFLTTARLSFGYGFGNAFLCVLAAGASAALVRGTVDPYVTVDALRTHRPTVLSSVPRLYAALLALGEEERDAYGPVRLCTTAGEHCPPQLADRIREMTGADLVDCFGATEVMHVALTTPPRGGTDGPLGFPVPGVRATVRDAAGAGLPLGQDGRLHIAGPTVALGYVNREGLDASSFADGGVYTGDLVRQEADGSFTYLCRADDIINLGGYKVVPAEIENVVRGVEGVAACAVVAARDDSGLEQAVACVQVAEGFDAGRTRRQVVAAARRQLPAHKRPSRVELFDSFPTTTSGKVSVRRLRERVTGA
ncbi:AMP-binding protein [Streptomyces luteireticuli]|uniref:AMP-binding protein n=1 Tax=Streptomyces luteireticuli TaxID=173858 RepID=UPI0035566EF4